jgi:cystathionine beta-lyase
VCRLLAKLEGADRAFCFTTGMSALSTITHLAKAGKLHLQRVPNKMKLVLLLHTFCYSNKTHFNLIAGQEIVAGDDIYGGSDRLLSQVCPKSGLVVKRIDTGNLDEVRAAVGPSTKIVWIESPTNPRQMISDIREIAKIAHEYGALLVVDNSIMSPVLSKPLDLGAGKVYI